MSEKYLYYKPDHLGLEPQNSHKKLLVIEAGCTSPSSVTPEEKKEAEMGVSPETHRPASLAYMCSALGSLS